MREHIGHTAGRIWHLLKEKEKLSIAQLSRALKEKAVMVHQALGWLACENKIVYHQEGDKISVSLTESERNSS